MKSAGKARNNGLYRHIRTSKEIIRNLLNYSNNKITELDVSGCDKLQDVDCSNNLMSSLNVSFIKEFELQPQYVKR